MVSARPLVARKGGAGHSLWHEEDAVTTSRVERYRHRREAICGATQIGGHALTCPADYDRTERRGKTMLP